jgi:hypothetical protein
MNMIQTRFTKHVWPYVLGCSVLLVGLLIGYWFGQTNLGQFLPRMLAVGAVVSFIVATYAAICTPLHSRQLFAERSFFTICLFICASVLSSSISATAKWQLSPYVLISGFMPYVDANNYYWQVLSWPAQTFDVWNSRRPLNATLNILQFHLGGSTLLGMILIRTVLATLAISAFIVALSRMVGRAAALTAGFVLLIWTWPYASSMLSEINGITVSSAAFTLLLTAFSQKRRADAYLGLFALVLASAFRPYNPLMPALFSFAVITALAKPWRKGLIVALLVAFVSTLLAVGVSKAIYYGYGHPNGSTNANTGYVVLGLARGTDWAEASAFVESISHGLTAQEKNVLMYETAIDSVKKDFRPMLRSLIIRLNGAVFLSVQELGGAMGFTKHSWWGWGWSQSVHRSLDSFIHFVTQHPSVWLPSLFACISFALLIPIRKTRMPITLLGGVSAITFISVAPVIFIDGGWRIVATLYPGLALLTTIIPLWIWHVKQANAHTAEALIQAPNRDSASRLVYNVAVAIIVLVLFAMPYPALFRLFNDEANPQANALILDVRHGETPRWLGLNHAVVSPNELVAWTTTFGNRYKDVALFISQHSNSIEQLGCEEDIYVFRAKAAAEIADQTILPSNFRVVLE